MSDVSALRCGAKLRCRSPRFSRATFWRSGQAACSFSVGDGSTSVYRSCIHHHPLPHLESIRVLTEKQLASHKRHEDLPVPEGGRATGHDAHHSPQTDSMHCPSATVRISCKACFESTDDYRSSIQSARSISLLAPRRPMLPSSSASTIPTPGSTSAPAIPSTGALDLATKISAHPALGSIQIRCGPRDTYNPSHLVRKRRHGFLSRIRTKKGRKLLMRRLKKGRWNLSH
jgi:large subunit ribosomal protein L34